jgi:hypothetical protein
MFSFKKRTLDAFLEGLSLYCRYDERRKFRKILLRVCKRRLDNDYKMPVRCSEEASLLQMCVALVLGEFFKINGSEKISNIFKNNTG